MEKSRDNSIQLITEIKKVYTRVKKVYMVVTL